MRKNLKEKVQTVNSINQTVEVSTNQQQQTVDKKLTTLKGFATSQVRKREKLSNTPAYCFLKTDEIETDIPVIFRIKEGNNWTKPPIKKGSYLAVQGNYAQSDKSRLSFTAYSYQLLNQLANQLIYVQS